MNVFLDSEFKIKSVALNCSVSKNGGEEKPCWATLDNEDLNHDPVSFNICVIPDNNESVLTAGDNYLLKIWTMGAEDGINGFVTPSKSGWYPISISAKDYSENVAEQVVDFTYIRGETFGYFDIISTIRNFGAKNLFTFRFYLPSGKVFNAYDHATKPGRIFLEFQTINDFA